MLDLLLIEWLPKMKPGSNSVEVHPQQASSGWCTCGCCFTVVQKGRRSVLHGLGRGWGCISVLLLILLLGLHSIKSTCFVFICSDKPIFEHDVHGTSFQLLVCILHQLDGLTSLCFVLFESHLQWVLLNWN